ncbi:MAG: hypothetical protein FWE04_05745 [Oscillospiraceae bacterium]|nr:hypothetical protein [Oscillospiraceae bacterium]
MYNYFSFLDDALNERKICIDRVFNILDDLDPCQCTIMSYLILKKSNLFDMSETCAVITELINRYPKIYKYLSSVNSIDELNLNLKPAHIIYEIEPQLSNVLNLLSNKSQVGMDNFKYVITKLINHDLDTEFIGLFLIMIYINGLSQDDLYDLTISMKNSGKIYDYRKFFDNKKIIRRYPTGALSEKVALILPSMLAYMSKDFPLISTFVVAKSLSFTGGTWSKLGVIEGFRFPNPGEETMEVLKKCNIAMTVTKEDLCPADRILYGFRSNTGTVNSIPLAVSSIASKQIACPADLLLLDVRYGEGAFFERDDAIELTQHINHILKLEGFDVINSLIDMEQPNGSTVGNYLELCEAICIMKNDILPKFDLRGISEQKDIILKFFNEIMEHYFTAPEGSNWLDLGENIIENGNILNAFKELLLAHQVCSQEVESLINDPFKHFNLTKVVDIFPQKEGKLTKIHQKKLGNIINFRFLDNNECQRINLLINKRLGDDATPDHAICSVYSISSQIVTKEEYDEILSCFFIE